MTRARHKDNRYHTASRPTTYERAKTVLVSVLALYAIILAVPVVIGIFVAIYVAATAP